MTTTFGIVAMALVAFGAIVGLIWLGVHGGFDGPLGVLDRERQRVSELQVQALRRARAQCEPDCMSPRCPARDAGELWALHGGACLVCSSTDEPLRSSVAVTASQYRVHATCMCCAHSEQALARRKDDADW